MENFKVVTIEKQLTISVRAAVKNEDIATHMSRTYGEIVMFVQERGIEIVGAPIAYYNSWNDKEVDLACAFPIAAPFTEEGKFKSFTIPSGKAVVAIHVGPYGSLMGTYAEMEKFIRENKMQPMPQMWEQYLNDPSEVPSDKLQTKIVWPIM